MNRYSKLPARFLLVLLGTILIAAGMTSVSLAATDTPEYHGSLFDVVEATSGTAYFSIISSCDGREYNCTVTVRGNPTDNNSGNAEQNWRDELQLCTNDDGSGDERYAEFEACWDGKSANFTVTWPTINPDDDFEITPYCQRGDDVCAEELRVCFNANDCDNNDYERREWTQVGELWEEADSCLYDDDDDEDIWECLDEALDDWLDDHMGSNDDYDDLEDERDNRRGFTLEDYEDDLDDVGDEQPRGRASETVLERYQRQWASRIPTSIYQS
ncbi:MAG: hypothetical protein J4G06_08710, partial [Caldilineaceae bacterium]|nr:hypothetical protein [Caldilineaceae bacterium]